MTGGVSGGVPPSSAGSPAPPMGGNMGMQPPISSNMNSGPLPPTGALWKRKEEEKLLSILLKKESFLFFWPYTNFDNNCGLNFSPFLTEWMNFFSSNSHFFSSHFFFCNNSDIRKEAHNLKIVLESHSFFQKKKKKKDYIFGKLFEWIFSRGFEMTSKDQICLNTNVWAFVHMWIFSSSSRPKWCAVSDGLRSLDPLQNTKVGGEGCTLHRSRKDAKETS